MLDESFKKLLLPYMNIITKGKSKEEFEIIKYNIFSCWNEIFDTIEKERNKQEKKENTQEN